MNEGSKRRAPSKREREEIYAKSGGRCHICGGELSDNWCADHVHPKFRGGQCEGDNFLACCATCNRLRWGHRPETIQHMLRIGMYMRSEIKRGTKLGKKVDARVKARMAQKARR
jgi:5-methylcytosine-specific restriction endonuclease McrA